MAGRYQNQQPIAPHGFRQILAWKLGLGPEELAVVPGAPDAPAASVAPNLPLLEKPLEGTWQVTWIGHGSWLLQAGGWNLLVDPIFSSHCAPLPLPGVRRRQPPGLVPEILPALDGILLTHSHYDHLDLPSLAACGRDLPLFVPEGHASWLGRKGFSRVTEVAWWDTVTPVAGLQVTATPAQHFTARTPFDRNRGHWCGWIVRAGGQRVFVAGDTGYASHFAAVRERHGKPDLAVIPIGAYAPRWVMRPVHLDPAEAVQAHLDLGARASAASHWGTFGLTDEAMGEPPLWLEQECRGRGVGPEQFRALQVGETWTGGQKEAPGPDQTSAAETEQTRISDDEPAKDRR